VKCPQNANRVYRQLNLLGESKDGDVIFVICHYSVQILGPCKALKILQNDRIFPVLIQQLEDVKALQPSRSRHELY
jgi:hypothetical protein